MDFMFDWEADGDRFSFEDSDRFEEDSLCSWISEPESLCNNWRGWRKQNGGPPAQLLCTAPSLSRHENQSPTPLVELAAQAVACYIPFEVVEHFYPPIPEQLQLRIAFWSFPENEEDIRLYSCLANGSADEFQKGEHLFKARAVKDALQIGFHLSATVIPPQTLAQAKGAFNVAVVFDRRRITSCNCTCSSSASWCAHVVALCLFRIHQATAVCLRAPVSESLSRLHRDQLQKFAQYLISELPQQILPTAQRLLDELLSSQQTAINTVCGAPDPTAGPSASEQTTWCLDETTLHENIKKTLIKFCVPSPIVFSDVNYLSSTAPPAAAEWQSLLRPLRGREPEGMWNLLSIVREMFRRNDSNAIPLLEILTEEVLACEQILVWWFTTKISASHNSSNGHSSRGNQNSSSSSQHAASSLCDEIVTLWRLSALNPALSPIQRDDLCQRFRDWHIKTIDKVRKGRSATTSSGASAIKKSDVEIFPGFKPSIEATQLDWGDYIIPEVTYVQKDRPRWRFSFNTKSQDGDGRKKGKGPTPTSGTGHKMGLEAALVQAHQIRQSQESNTSDFDPGSNHTDGACSSSSEGFCENDRLDGAPPDSDSDLCDLDIPCKKPSCNKIHHNVRTSGGIALHCVSVALPKVMQAGKPVVPGGEASSKSSSGAATVSNSKHEYSRDNGEKGKPPSGSKASKGAEESPGDTPQGGATARPSGSQNGSAAAGNVELGGGAAAAAAAAGVKGDHSESQQSSDEYQVYFYDTKAKLTDNTADKKKKNEEPNYFAGIKKMENKQDVSILFARAEALHAHGHTREACKLAKQLAEEMLANPPDLTTEPPPHPSGGKGESRSTHAKPTEPPPHQGGKGKKKKSQNNISSFASTTLAKAAFLCSVLLEDPECHHLAFKVGMFGLEMPRPPASSKALEVKLAHQESELVGLLKRIPLGPGELAVIGDRAEKLRDGKLKCRGEALLPLTLASFIFDSLCLPVMCTVNVNSRPPSRSVQLAPRNAADEKLGFEAAVAALGLKANVSEADHPLLCEGTRRQRGDLAIAMLVHYKDDQVKLSKVMDKLLDKEVHQLYKAPSLSNYLRNSASAAAAAAVAAAHASGGNHSGGGKVQQPNVTPKGVPLAGGEPMGPQSGRQKPPGNGFESDDSLGAKRRLAAMKSSTGVSSSTASTVSSAAPVWHGPPEEGMGARAQSLDYLNLEQKFTHMSLHSGAGARPKTSMLCRYSSKDTDSSAVEEDGDNPDYKAWEAKFRCTNLKGTKKPSVGMAAIDSSAPETTSSDNSPTLVRRNWTKHQGPGSDSGSSGKSSDSLGSSSSGDKAAAAKIRDNESPPGVFGGVRFAPHLIVDSRSSTPNIKGTRFKGKNRVMPTVPNQPSEASAHFMFELAKTVLTKAGGNSSTSLFTQPATSTSHSGPHRALHLCAFQIGLYALGLHNCVSPNWLSRTYSSHVSWITGQAMEIGSAAINILIDTWEGHLTPPEVASLADRASRGRDPNMVRAAAELALSCLPHAHALNPNEIQRALIQCKEQSREMLERACSAVEIAAKGGGVYPEVLFDVAKRWYELYEESMATHSPGGGGRGTVVAVVQQPDPQMQAQAQVQAQALVPIAGAQAVVVEANQPVMQLVPCVAAQSVAAVQQGAAAANGAQLPTAMAVPPIPYTIPPPAPSHPQLPHHPYIAPYSYVQQMPPNFGHHYSQPHIPLHTHSMHPSYMATYPYNGQTAAFANVPHLQNLHPNPATLYHANVSHLRPPPPTAVQITYTSQPAGQQVQLSSVAARGGTPAQIANHKFQQAQPVEGQVVAAVAVSQAQVLQQQQQPVQQQAAQQPQQADPAAGPPVNLPPAQNSVQMNYLMATYRVGMLAMETLARRVHDDRPQTKYARNPPYGEDVKWLLAIAMKLGTSYLQQFCASAVNAVVSPFVLQDIALESAHFLARSNPAQVPNQLRSPTLNSLVQKCLQMFIQCTHQRMHHITQAEYEEFVGIVCSARNAFCMTPGGMVQFNELLQSLRRSKSCKKELWQRIVNGLATGGI